MITEQRKNFEKAAGLMLLSSIGFSFFTLFVKLGTGSVSFFFLTFLRFLVPFLLVIPYLWWSGRLEGVKKIPHLPLQLSRVACILVYQFGIFYYLTKSSLLNATLLQNLAPAFVPILDRIFYKHPIHKITAISIAVSLAGILCIFRPGPDLFAWIMLVGIGVAVAQGGSQLLYGLQSRRENNQAALFYLYGLSAFFSGIIYWISTFFRISFTSDLDALVSTEPSFYFYLLALSVFSIFNQTVRGLAYRYSRPSLLAIFFYFSIIVSGLLDWIVFGDIPDRWTVIGSVIIITGGFIQYYHRGVPEID